MTSSDVYFERSLTAKLNIDRKEQGRKEEDQVVGGCSNPGGVRWWHGSGHTESIYEYICKTEPVGFGHGR